MIVLDTDVVSELMRPRPSEALIRRLADVPIEEQSTTAVTIGELAYGAIRAGRPDLYDRSMELLGDTIVLAFDRPAAERYGQIRSDLGRGTPLADPDLRIAATVLVHGATLITGNTKHFRHVPELQFEDWLRG